MQKIKFEAIGPDIIKQRLGANFSNSYLTLVSIIQGVAFGIWYSNISDLLIISGFRIHLFIYPAFSLMAIILIVFYYSWFVSVIYTPPDILEALVPILLAVFEIVPMYFFEQPNKWWYFSGMFYLMGVISFSNTIRNIERNEYDPGQIDIKHEMKSELTWNMKFLLVMAGLAFWCSTSFPSTIEYNHNISNKDIIFLVIQGVLVFAMAYKSTKFLSKIYCYAKLFVCADSNIGTKDENTKNL